MTTLIDLTAKPLTLPLEIPHEGIMSRIGARTLIPKECWDAYYKMPRAGSGVQTATTPDQIGAMLNELFFNGLSSLTVTVRPHVTNTGREVIVLLREVLRNRNPKHEHKVAWCIYMLHSTCGSLEWRSK